MELVDILIHVRPTLPVAQREAIESDFKARSGVLAACFSCRHPHLLTVAYDPATVSSLELVERVRDRGIGASWIGL
jgi:hypothetical protein